MDDRPAYEVQSWASALAVVRHLSPEALVTVPKDAEPTLPDDPAVRRSNVPWSIHKGARRVYREDRPGDHVQIREYADRWTVERDSYNPHYRPVRHVAADTPAYTRYAVTHPVGTTADLFMWGPLRTAQMTGQFATTAALKPLVTVDDLLGRVVDSVDRVE